MFLENEIAYHQTMLRVLDDTLAVAAQSAAERTHLAQVRAVVQAHLHEARRLQSAGAH